MIVYEALSHEPPLMSPNHTAQRASRHLGGFLGRIVIASIGEGYDGAVAAAANAFPETVRSVQVHGLMPARWFAQYDEAGMDAMAQMHHGFETLRHSRGLDRVRTTGASDSTTNFTLIDHITGEMMRIWGASPDDSSHGLVFVTHSETLPGLFDQRPEPVAQTLRLSGISVQPSAPHLNLQWQQLHPDMS